MVASYSRWHGRWNRNKKSGESFLPVQFGGSGNDVVSTIKVASTGDIIVSGYTFSQDFCGYNTSAYTNGSTTICYFLLKLSSKFEITGAYFFSSTSGRPGAGWLLSSGYYDFIITFTEIGFDGIQEFIVYNAGDFTAGGTQWNTYFIRISDMTKVYNYSSFTPFSIYYDSIVFAGQDENNLYMAAIGGGSTFYNQLLIISKDVTHARTAITTTTYKQQNINCCYDGEYIWFFTNNYAQTTTIIRRRELTSPYGATDYDLVGIFKLSSDDPYTSPMNEFIADCGSDLLIGGFAIGTNDLLIIKRTKADLSAAPSGWSNYTLSVGSGKVIKEQIGKYYDSESDRLLYLYATDDGSTGTSDVKLLTINASTGALISNNPIKYKNGTEVGQSTKAMLVNGMNIDKVSSGKYVICGNTTGNITGYSNLGGTDGFIMIICIVTGKQIGRAHV